MINVFRHTPEKGLILTTTPTKDTKAGEIVWTDIEAPVGHETDVLSKIFGFHPLAVEDSLKKRQRAKVDDYKDYFFVVAHSLDNRSDTLRLTVKEIAIFMGRDFIVTFHWEEIGPVSAVRDRIQKNPGILAKGTDYLLYLILDALVDECFPILDHIDDRFLAIEARMLKSPGNADITSLSTVKRTLVEMRKILSPHRDMVNALIRYEGIFIRDENRVFYHDVYDHLMRIFDFLDTYRDIISGSLDIYLTSASNRMSEIMKTLTVIATIVLPLTLISSIYGMNFRYMPELGWRYGYLWAVWLMVTCAGGMVYYFKRKNWF